MTNYKLLLLLLPCCVLLAVGCKRNSQREVWRSYDYLDPVPYNSGIAVDSYYRTNPYGRQVYDNDDTYVIPYGSGLCSADGNYQECE